MKIHAYIIAYNEEKMIRHTLNHYAFVCEKVFLYDNHSTDRTVEIAGKYPFVEIRTFDSGNKIDERAYLKVKNNCWKGSQADYVIVCDADEFLYSKNLNMDLSWLSERKVSLPKVEGYDMVCDEFPEDYSQLLTRQVKTGIRSQSFDKQMIFDPKRIREINYRPGAHACYPKGNLLTSEKPALKLLHYKYMGVEHVQARHTMYAQRLSRYNKENKYGAEYMDQKSNTQALFRPIRRTATQVI